jgi:hypothetical protein
MKKITKSDLKGLAETFPVCNEDTMRKAVGGMTADEMMASLMSRLEGQGTSVTDANGNTYWHVNDGSSSYPYTQNQFKNWGGPWDGGYVYGLGYVMADIVIMPVMFGGGYSYYGSILDYYRQEVADPSGILGMLYNSLGYVPVVGDALNFVKTITSAKNALNYELLMRNLQNNHYSMDRGFYIREEGLYYKIYDDTGSLLGEFRKM